MKMLKAAAVAGAFVFFSAGAALAADAMCACCEKMKAGEKMACCEKMKAPARQAPSQPTQPAPQQQPQGQHQH